MSYVQSCLLQCFIVYPMPNHFKTKPLGSSLFSFVYQMGHVLLSRISETLLHQIPVTTHWETLNEGSDNLKWIVGKADAFTDADMDF